MIQGTPKITSRLLQNLAIKDDTYPFVNPLIVTKDNAIVDGLERFRICKGMKLSFSYLVLEYNRDELRKPDCITQIREIQSEQRSKLEEYFKKHNIGYKEQIKACSSVDRIKKFFQLRSKFNNDQEYWKYLGYAYIISDNNFSNRYKLRELFNSKRPYKELLMTSEEREFLMKLPEEIIIYRGMSIREDLSRNFGISWTLSKSIALDMAHKYAHNYDTTGEEKTVK